jgi:hypothetical protein
MLVGCAVVSPRLKGISNDIHEKTATYPIQRPFDRFGSIAWPRRTRLPVSYRSIRSPLYHSSHPFSCCIPTLPARPTAHWYSTAPDPPWEDNEHDEARISRACSFHCALESHNPSLGSVHVRLALGGLAARSEAFANETKSCSALARGRPIAWCIRSEDDLSRHEVSIRTAARGGSEKPGFQRRRMVWIEISKRQENMQCTYRAACPGLGPDDRKSPWFWKDGCIGVISSGVSC